MPTAEAVSPDGIQAIQAVLLAIVAAWVAVRTRQLDTASKAADKRAEAHRDYCEGLEKRVKKLEELTRRSKRGKRPPKRPPTRKRK